AYGIFTALEFRRVLCRSKPPPEPGNPVMLGTDPKRKPVGGDGDSGGERRAAVQLPVYIKAHRLAVIGRRDMDPPAVNRRGIGLRDRQSVVQGSGLRHRGP